MPDISMCEGGDCPRKETCYRFTATPTPRRQTYFATPPVRDGECEHYWPVVERAIHVDGRSRSGFVPWPDDEPPRFNACTDPCDMWTGPCACGAWHREGR